MERSNVIDNWRYLSLHDKPSINKAIAQQHNAAQYIAMAGNYLIPQKEDDSNTHMKWEAKEGVLLGNKIKGRAETFQVALSITELELMIMEGKSNIAAIFLPLPGFVPTILIREVFTRSSIMMMAKLFILSEPGLPLEINYVTALIFT